MGRRRPAPSPIVEELRRDLSHLIDEATNPELSRSARRSFERDIREIIAQLGRLLDDLDPVRQPVSVFDPSNPKVVGRFVALAMVAQERHPLGEIEAHYGSGVYAIYYLGDFDLYAPLSGTETPIYVGQAAPKVRNARTAMEQGEQLSRRLGEHARSISRARSTLDMGDFEYRSLVVQSGWETAAEDYLIHLFRPIWNSETNILYGLGKHGDNASTRANRRSPWDTLHPGRAWAAASLEDAKTPERITMDLEAHFA